MHNGVIYGLPQDKERSDTNLLVEKFLRPRFQGHINPHQLIRSNRFRKNFEALIGAGSRVVLLDRGGPIFFNRVSWHTSTTEGSAIKGAMFSNYAGAREETFRPKDQSYIPSTTTSYHSPSGYSGSPEQVRASGSRAAEEVARRTNLKISGGVTAGNITWHMGRHPQGAVATSATGLEMWHVNSGLYQDKWGNYYVVRNNTFIYEPNLQKASKRGPCLKFDTSGNIMGERPTDRNPWMHGGPKTPISLVSVNGKPLPTSASNDESTSSNEKPAIPKGNELYHQYVVRLRGLVQKYRTASTMEIKELVQNDMPSAVLLLKGLLRTIPSPNDQAGEEL